LVDSEGLPATVLRSGRPATVRMDFHAHTRVRDVVFGLRINHLHGLNLFGTNTRRRNVIIEAVDGPGVVEFTFDHLPLLEGVYELTVAVSDHTEAHAYDHWEKRLRFEVDQSGIYDDGVVRSDGRWDVDARLRRRA
jgi:hypothetical protein